MTEMPIEHAAHAAVHPAPHPSGVAARLREVIPDLHRLAARPALLDAVARATAAGVPDAEVEGLIAGLHGLAHKHEGLARQNGGGVSTTPVLTPSPVIWTAPAPDDHDHDTDRSM